MYTLPNFCRVCLKYDKNLIDLAHIENEPSETLLSKLQKVCAEVEWNVFKPLLCHPCIKRLNIAYGFKKQCLQASSVLKNYVQLVRDNQKKKESSTGAKVLDGVPQGSFMILPNQKYVKILVGTQNQAGGANSFQNVFLNLIPATTTPTTTDTKTKDTNQNVFLNLNSTFQKFIPLTPTGDSAAKKENKNLNQLLTESKSEELSVELNPLDFTGLEDEDEDDEDQEDTDDWDEVISPTKIDSKTEENGVNGNNKQKFVPILPKQEDFFSSGQHFLSPHLDMVPDKFSCERCSKTFPSMVRLKNHIKMFHLGKLPFKCDICYLEYATRTDYDLCVKGHKIQMAKNKQHYNKRQYKAADISEEDLKPNETGDYVCDICKRLFSSSTGLLRHKVRKHNQKNKKKYFIKGVKNARCDICNREFSTQSYMQLHRKLHMRDDVGYKYKVFGKSKYGMAEENAKEEEEEEGDKTSESIDVTPDIVMDDDSDKEIDESEVKEEDDDEDRLKMDESEVKSDQKDEDDELEGEVERRDDKMDGNEEEDEDSDENRLKMDIENGDVSENEENNEEETLSEEN
ncbi:unnamed protein product [Brassicogethes aeneus]|uniref:Uncharacterized protein n=1 Tax=Brassicogethes aeneus TaxID=1431903 RepID=A0A9P0B8J8_BRAAE|nr:unnamed protein product [Brassicogethes aeneus]